MNQIAGWMGKNAESLRITATYNLPFTAWMMVEEGLGCALAIDKLLPSGSPLHFRPLIPALTADVFLVWKNTTVYPRAAALFLSALQTNFHQQ